MCWKNAKRIARFDISQMSDTEENELFIAVWSTSERLESLEKTEAPDNWLLSETREEYLR